MTNWFRKRRDELGITQRTIANAIVPQMTAAAVASWEAFIAPPRSELRDQLAAIYRVSPNRIAEEIGNVAAESARRRLLKRKREAKELATAK